MIGDNLLSFLPLFLAFDLVLPFLLAPFYKGYDHLTQVMSVLGNVKAPLHFIYNSWLILFGAVLLISSFALYVEVKKTSDVLATILFITLAIYAIGGCVLSGLFPVGETKELESFAAKIHGYGSATGFLVLTFAPLCTGIYFFKVMSGWLGVFSLVCFVLALLFFVLFVMADKPKYQGTPIALEGLWQRSVLLCMYLPLAVFCITGAW